VFANQLINLFLRIKGVLMFTCYKHFLKSVCLMSFIISVFILGTGIEIEAYNDEFREVSVMIAETIKQAGINRVAVTDFINLEGDITELGRFLAEHFSVALAGSERSIGVVDRTHIKTLLREHKLSETGLIDTTSAKQLGQIAGIEALITGIITPFEDTIQITIKVLDIETAEIIDARIVSLPKTQAVQELLQKGTTISNPSNTSAQNTQKPITIQITPRENIPANFSQDVPNFPWPPPKSSANEEIPANFLRNQQNSQTYLRDVANRLETALEQAGYGEKSWYLVPDGFVMVSRIEQFNIDGTPKEEANRWSTEIGGIQEFSLTSYMRALFKAKEGHYRVIVFLVTSQPFKQDAESIVSPQKASEWLVSGTNVLPETLLNRIYTPNYRCTALIYEFEQATKNHEPVFKYPSHLTGRIHLEKAKLWDALQNQTSKIINRNAHKIKLSIDMLSCEKSNESVTCYVLIESDQDTEITLFSKELNSVTRIFDNLGNEYWSKEIQFGNKKGNTSITQSLIYDIPFKTTFRFEGVAPEAQTIALFEINGRGGEDFKVRFRNIPLSK
jgi:hypothetical protein